MEEVTPGNKCTQTEISDFLVPFSSKYREKSLDFFLVLITTVNSEALTSDVYRDHGMVWVGCLNIIQ